jgi:hypothetical protein
MILDQARAKLKKLTDARRIDDEQITVTCKALSRKKLSATRCMRTIPSTGKRADHRS